MRMSSCAWIFLLCFPLLAAAQHTTNAPDIEPQPITSQAVTSETQLTLDVVVTGKSGKVVPGLHQQDFTLFDNRQARPILSFKAQGTSSLVPSPPAQLILILDEVNISFERVAFARDQLVRFLRQNGGKLAQPTSLVYFSDLGTQIQDAPTTDGNGLAASLDQHETALRTIRRSSGIYGAEDRVDLSLKTLGELAAHEATLPGRKMVVWISPGWPILSGPRIDLTSKEEQGIFNSVVSLSAALRRARITLYSVDPLGLDDDRGLRNTYYQEFLKGVTRLSQTNIGDLALQVLATQSGGIANYGNNSVVDGINRCIADAAAFYTLTLQTMPAERPNEYHDIDVKVAPSGLTARTRTGYYAQPGASSTPASAAR